MKTLLGMLLFSCLVAVASAQSTPNFLQQLLGQSRGQTGNNAQLIAQLKQRADLEFLVANQGINFFLVRKSVTRAPAISGAVVVGIYPSPVIRGGQQFVGSATELQIRCASNDFRQAKETALNAQLNLVEGVIAANLGGGFTPFASSGVAYEVSLRLCASPTHTVRLFFAFDRSPHL